MQQADACWVGQQLDAAAFPFLALLGCSTQQAGGGAARQQQQQPAVQVQVLDHLEGVGRVGVETVSWEGAQDARRVSGRMCGYH